MEVKKNQSSMPKITVVTVCYNIVTEIEQTILSVLNQTYTHLEYIVIDGGSTDGTIDIIKRYADKITNWVSEPDKGIYDAMNKAINLASGDYINFMNAGDTFADASTIKSIFEGYEGSADVIYGDVLEYFPNHGTVLKRMDKLFGSAVALGLCHQSTFIKLAVHRHFKYDLSFNICADRNMFFQILQSGYKFEYVPVSVSCYEQLGGISSTHLFRARKEGLRITGEHWYSSLGWWISLLKILFKELQRFIYGQDKYNQKVYERVCARYSSAS